MHFHVRRLAPIVFALLLAGCSRSTSSSSTSTSTTGGTTTPQTPLALLAGNMNGAGTADGTGTAARFSNPTGIAVDGAGNLYVADTSNSTIRKIDSTGTVTTFAGGAGISGSADGSGSAARFFGPQGLALDSSGNLIVADTDNNTIREITPAGAVTTLAGTAGQFGTANGQGSAARFSGPAGVTVAPSGTIFVADTNNSLIRAIDGSGNVTLFAGTVGAIGASDGVGTASTFDIPNGIVSDSLGDLFVSDTYNGTIRKILPDATVSTFAGTQGLSGTTDGVGAQARFSFPLGLSVDGSDTLFLADASNDTVRSIMPNATTSTVAGTALVSGHADGPALSATFAFDSDVAVDGSGNIFVADSGNNLIRKVSAGGTVSTVAGSAPVFGSTDGTGAAAQFRGPLGLAADGTGNVYVADTVNDTIRKITAAGVVSTFAGAPLVTGNADGNGSSARFAGPIGLATDAAGNVYVADTGNNTIRKITPTGDVTTLAGAAGVQGSADGTGNGATFNRPLGIAVDSAGTVFVADAGNSTIREITPAGVVTTLAGTAGISGSTDGTGGAASFFDPAGLAVDTSGNLYVADLFNNTIRKVTPGGTVSTLAGTAVTQGSADGTGAAARFNRPQDVATDGNGNVYVADSPNKTVRKIDPSGVVTTVVGVAGQSGFTAGNLPGLIGPPTAVAVHGNSLYITCYNGVAVVSPLP